MKDSGVEWIGKIPNDWEVSKIKYAIKKMGSGGTPLSSNVNYYGNEHYWIQTGDLYDKDYIDDTAVKITEQAVIENSFLNLYQKEFIVLAMYGSVGNVAISRINAYTNQSICSLQPNLLFNIGFLYYYLKTSKNELINRAVGGIQPNISQTIIKNFPVLEINVIEQQEIANYLDKKVDQIDIILDILRKQISTLGDYKQSLITETVTKGLNRNVKMKDSGVEWIGEIPNDWEVQKIKHIVKIPITDGPHETPIFVDEGISFYSVDSIQENKIIYEPCRYISKQDALKYDKKIKPQRDDILFGKAASVGKIALVDKDLRFQIWSPLAIIRVNTNVVIPGFLKFYLISSAAQSEIMVKVTTNTQMNISMQDINNINLTCPLITEQQTIANYLDKKTSKIDNIIKGKEKQIKELSDYKDSLIYEYVTGKKRIKNA